MSRLLALGLLSAALSCAVAAVAGPGAKPRWVASDLGTIAGGVSEALAVNDAGQVVGYAGSHAFLWEHGKLRDLGKGYAIAVNEHGSVLINQDVTGTARVWARGRVTDLKPTPGDCASSMARALNERGQIVGWSGARDCEGLQMSLTWRAAVWSGETMEPEPIASTNTEAVAVNDRGRVLVNRDFGTPLLWRAGRATSLGGPGVAASGTSINDRGQVAGTLRPASGHVRAFIWQSGKLRTLGLLPGAVASSITGVSRIGDRNFETYYPKPIDEHGKIVGTSQFRDESCRAVLWDRGTTTGLGALPGQTTCEQPAINERGEVVGTVGVSTGKTVTEHAYVWVKGALTYLPSLGGSGTFAAAINDRGQIVGSSKTANGKTHAVIWTLRAR